MGQVRTDPSFEHGASVELETDGHAAATAPAAAKPPAPDPGRYLFVDALRGVAAFGVVLYHQLHCTVMDATLHRILPTWFVAICDFGRSGVDVFFVISGFVIAHSVRRLAPTWQGIGNFVLRRQLRLDPPYWLIIGLTLVEFSVANHVPGLVHEPYPRLREIATNFLYLQNIMHSGEIVAVAWTLCLEIQFYLVFIAATSLGWWLSGEKIALSPWTVACVGISAVCCLPLARSQFESIAWFFPSWPYFAFGAMVNWTTHRCTSIWWLVAFALLFAAETAWSASSDLLVGLCTALAIFAAAETGKLRTLGSNVVLQYLGRISYSLYLVHILVLVVVLRVGYKLTYENPRAALGWFILSVLLSVLIADLFHRIVEAPSMRWSSALRGRQPLQVSTRPA